MSNSNTKKLTVRDLTSIAMMSVIIAVCSWLTVPFVVPFTMQTFAVFFALEYLGGRRGIAAVALYILLGIVGLPVFSGFTGGVGHLMGPTGGFIIGFILSAMIYWLGERFISDNVRRHIALMLICLAACYALGTVWFAMVYKTSIFAALCSCVFPFIVPDIIKILLVTLVVKRLNKRKN